MSAAEDDPMIIERYKQAHENRRKWEGYIWQWGVILTVLAALFAGFGKSIKDVSELSPEGRLAQRLVLLLVTSFVIAISLNVWRARALMKTLERALEKFNPDQEELPTTPRELDAKYPPKFKVSSTFVAFACHVAACVVFVYLTVYAWVA
ncbi:hypothetical protein ACFWP2_29095 [Kitasatospora sp. NPDC058444]|uniref:hypothetical protein n=1 Tax=Kitasatospora sp. NPDC058444 TaxID=3346504 RepID=UPI0036545B8D